MADILSPDGDLINADWIKALSWDVWTADREKLVSTYDELAAFVSPNGEDVQKRISAFLKRPAAIPMPKKLKDELRARGFTPPGSPEPRAEQEA